MAFVSQIDDSCSLPFELYAENGELTAQALIGYDEASGVFYLAEASLGPEVGTGDMEVMFCLLADDGEDGPTERILDSARGRAIIPPELRGAIVQIFATLVRELLTRLKPPRVNMNAYETHLPSKAQVKYESICAAAREAGYDARGVDSWHGHHMWAMKLVE